jgi:iron complex outermembrane receptor protein
MKQLLLILTVIFSAGLTAQEIKVSGVVMILTQNFTRHIILVKGTSKGTSTDADGNISYLQLLEIFYNFLWI